MYLLRRLIFLLIFIPSLCFAEFQLVNDVGETTFQSTATTPIMKGTSLPSTCSVGDRFFDTDATAGQNIYGCTATNTWTLQGDGNSGGAPAWGTVTGTLANQTDLNTALGLKATIDAPTFTGIPAAPTASAGTNTTQLATTAFATTADNLKANLASPAFTGTPTGIGIPVYAQVTGSNATTTGQSLVDVTGLSVALTTNAVYDFEAVMSCSTTAVTTGTAYGVQYSVAGGAIEASCTGSSTATATKTLRITALNTATALYLAGSAQTGGILIKGRITTGANAGNLTIQHLKLTSGTSTVFIGSFLKVTRIS